MEKSCLFCQIIQGEIPSTKIYEDEQVLAFLDISQVTKGHTLLIPKAHSQSIFEMIPEKAGQLLSHLPKLAKAIQAATGAKGMNIVNNSGETAGQTIFHTHFHLLPRYDAQTDGFQVIFETQDLDKETLDQLGKSIACEVSTCL